MKIGFVNGCFDRFHDGHKLMLASALNQCDHLVIALNSDESVRRLKGTSRPVWDWKQRFIAIRSFCDPFITTAAIIPFEGDKDPLLMNIRPDIFFVGYDHRPHPVFYRKIGWKKIARTGEHFFEGPQVIQLPHLEGVSTTKLLEDEANETQVHG